jgi:hypothetical protein
MQAEISIAFLNQKSGNAEMQTLLSCSSCVVCVRGCVSAVKKFDVALPFIHMCILYNKHKCAGGDRVDDTMAGTDHWNISELWGRTGREKFQVVMLVLWSVCYRLSLLWINIMLPSHNTNVSLV